MKRDMDLVRKILLAIEACEGYPPTDLKIDGYESSTVGYHIFIMGEADLLETSGNRGDGSFEAIAHRLTWKGHEFLDAARNETVWNQARAKIGPVGGAVFGVWLQVLTQLTVQKLGLGS